MGPEGGQPPQNCAVKSTVKSAVLEPMLEPDTAFRRFCARAQRHQSAYRCSRQIFFALSCRSLRALLSYDGMVTGTMSKDASR